MRALISVGQIHPGASDGIDAEAASPGVNSAQVLPTVGRRCAAGWSPMTGDPTR